MAPPFRVLGNADTLASPGLQQTSFPLGATFEKRCKTRNKRRRERIDEVLIRESPREPHPEQSIGPQPINHEPD